MIKKTPEFHITEKKFQVEYNIRSDQQSSRLDVYLANCLSITRNKIQKAIINNQVQVNNKIISKNKYQINKGDLLYLSILSEDKNYVLPSLKIAYESKDIIIVDKQPNLSVQSGPAWEKINLTQIINKYLPDNKFIPNSGLIHRLDKDTSGLLVVSKNLKTYLLLKNLMKKRKIIRIYAVVVKGKIRNNFIKINKKVCRSKNDRKKMMIHSSKGKESITFLKLVQSFNNYSLVYCCLRSGRMHQIRLHCQSIGCPIVGDPVYGKVSSKFIKRQALHAMFLKIKDLNLSIKSPIPKDIKELISCCK